MGALNAILRQMRIFALFVALKPSMTSTEYIGANSVMCR